MSKAQIQTINGTPRLVIDGEVYSGMATTVTCTRKGVQVIDREYYRQLGESGIRIFFVMCDTDFRFAGAYDKFKAECEAIVEVVPDAYIIPRIGLHPSAEWMESHPDAAVQYSDGSHPRINLRLETMQTDDVIGYALYSHEWRRDAGVALEDFMDCADSEAFADHIIGYFLCAGSTSEWLPVASLTIGETQPYYGLGEDFECEYRNYLRETYGENAPEPIVPDNSVRQYIWGFDSAVKNRPNQPTFDISKGVIPEKGVSLGSFADVTNHREVLDFFMAWGEAVAGSIIHFAKIVKRRSPDKITGCFYGYTRVIHDSGNFAGLRKIINSGVVDFCSAPGDYENRQPGGNEPPRTVADTYKVNNMIFVAENDTRTHRENPTYRANYGVQEVADSLNVIKRNFGKEFCGLNYGWWFDQHHGGGRFNDPDILALFAKQAEIAKSAGERRWKRCSEVAFVYDIESRMATSFHSTDQSVSKMKYYTLNNVGLPYDEYLVDDLDRIGDYKLYIFASACYLDDRKRELIRRKLAKNNAVALWMYGAGLMNPDADEIVSVGHMKELTGFEVAMQYDTVYDEAFKPYGEGAIAAKLRKNHAYGNYERRMDNNQWPQTDVQLKPYLCPRFTVECEDGEVIGRFCEDKTTAVAIRSHDGFRSIFCGVKYVPHDFIRAIAEFAGCHVYSDSGDVLYASENFITFHAASGGVKTLKLPRVASPIECYDGTEYGVNVREFSFEVYEGETRMFELR